MFNLAVCYMNGEGVKKDMETAVTLYQQAADKGYALAINNLAWCYANGLGVKKDMKKASVLYQQYFSKGHQRRFLSLLFFAIKTMGARMWQRIKKAIALHVQK